MGNQQISIRAQHLDGNDPEGFDARAWCVALEAEYRQIAETYAPLAAITVTIERQRASGAARPVSVEIEGDDADDINRAGLELTVEQAANYLYDRRGSGPEFYR